MTSTLHEDQYTSMMKYGLVFLTIKNVSDKNGRENQNIYYVQFIFYSKMVPLMSHRGKILQSRIGHR
jgi:hypothetical protein